MLTFVRLPLAKALQQLGMTLWSYQDAIAVSFMLQ